MTEAALDVWHAARIGLGRPPEATRIDRVRTKLADPDALLVVLREDAEVVAMGLVEPHHDEPTVGHVSMVFVHPAHQRQGLGARLMAAVHERSAAHGWAVTTVWTRADNDAARRLYAAAGYAETGAKGETPDGDPTHQWRRG